MSRYLLKILALQVALKFGKIHGYFKEPYELPAYENSPDTIPDTGPVELPNVPVATEPNLSTQKEDLMSERNSARSSDPLDKLGKALLDQQLVLNTLKNDMGNVHAELDKAKKLLEDKKEAKENLGDPQKLSFTLAFPHKHGPKTGLKSADRGNKTANASTSSFSESESYYSRSRPIPVIYANEEISEELRAALKNEKENGVAQILDLKQKLHELNKNNHTSLKQKIAERQDLLGKIASKRKSMEIQESLGYSELDSAP